MASKKNKINHKKIATKLKQLGFIDYDLRLKLSPGQKGYITKQYNKARDIIKNPEDYSQKKVSKSVLKILKKNDVIVNNKFAYVEKSGYQSVSIQTRKTKNKKRTVNIIKKRPGKSEKTLMLKGNALLRQLRSLKNDLPRGQYWTVRVGKNAPFNRRYAGAAELHHFADSLQANLTGELIDQLSLVKFEGK